MEKMFMHLLYLPFPRDLIVKLNNSFKHRTPQLKNDIANVKNSVRYHSIKIPHITNLLGISSSLIWKCLKLFFNWYNTDDRYTIPTSPGPSYGEKYIIDNQKVKILVLVLLLTSCQNLYKSFQLFESHFTSNTGVG